tara:strand:+ start:38342 stop:39124 length:783 start_codon:yes stop_codon:yes gene_type:complete
VITREEILKKLSFNSITGELYKKGSMKVAGRVRPSGARTIDIGSRAYEASRIVWFLTTGSWPVGKLRHKDGDKLNNRFDNLVELTSKWGKVKNPTLEQLLEYLYENIHYDENSGKMFWKAYSLKHNKGEELSSVDNCGYPTVRIMGKHYRQHRLVFLMENGRWPESCIDHKNGDTKDNRRCNLREVTKKQNSKNIKRRSDNTSGIMGVSWAKYLNKWETYINVDGEKIPLGNFEDFFEACCARKSAEVRYNFYKNHGREV